LISGKEGFGRAHKDPELLLPQSLKRSRQTDREPRPRTATEILGSEERDHALLARAKRAQEEIAVERARFELIRDKILFVLGLALAAFAVVTLTVLLIVDPGALPPGLLSGYGLGCAALLSRRPRSG
jgi:hypothetical protein